MNVFVRLSSEQINLSVLPQICLISVWPEINALNTDF